MMPTAIATALPSPIASRMKVFFSQSSSSCCAQLGIEQRRLLFIVTASSAATLLEHLFSPSSSYWVPILLILWLSMKEEREQRKVDVGGMNERRKWYIQNTQPLSPLEPCEWLNKLIMNIWPNYMEPKLSHRCAALMMKTLKQKKPKFIENIELEEFSLGLAPPTVGLDCTYWTRDGDEEILHTGLNWNSDEMSIVLAMTIAGIRVNVVISNLQVKGNLKIVPVLHGKCVLYSFESPPEVRIGVTFGVFEIPGIASLLEKMLLRILVKTMVEPHRSCLSFPSVNLNKRVSGGTISVRVISGNNLGAVGNTGVIERKDRSMFVVVTLENVSRKTKVSDGDLSPHWDETFEMMLDGSTGSIYFNVHEKELENCGLRSLGQCKIKVKYIQDDSTVFWCTGRNNSSIAVLAEHPGKEVEMKVPLIGSGCAELTVKLVLNQWHFIDDAAGPPLHSILSSVSRFQQSTGRVMKITVEEGRNLAAKDKLGKSDPYVLLQYGKTVRRTKTVSQNLDPSWNQTFEFAEISGEEYLRLKCYDADMLIDDSLGSARVNVEGLEDDECRDMWVPLANMEVGEIRLIIKMLPSQSTSNEPEAANTRHGMLELVLVEARNLIAADLCGTSDPFIIVQYGKQRKRTKVIHRTLKPRWNQTLQFLEDENQTLKLYVKDHNALLPTSSIGDCVVEYKTLPENETRDFWIPLKGVKKGEVHVKVTRRSYAEKIVPKIKQCTSANGVLAQMSSAISGIVEAHQLAEDGDMAQLCNKIAEIESIGTEQDVHISQVLKEKEMLLSKITELERSLRNQESIL